MPDPSVVNQATPIRTGQQLTVKIVEVTALHLRGFL